MKTHASILGRSHRRKRNSTKDLNDVVQKLNQVHRAHHTVGTPETAWNAFYPRNQAPTKLREAAPHEAPSVTRPIREGFMVNVPSLHSTRTYEDLLSTEHSYVHHPPLPSRARMF